MTGSLAVVPTVVAQHTEEAAFLWLVRRAAVADPHYSLKDCADLDGRVEAHLDGLRVAGNDGWNLCREALTQEEAGEIFAAAVLALESYDGQRFDEVLEVAVKEPETFEGITSALGWVSVECADSWLPTLIASKSSVCRRLGIAGHAVNRIDSKHALVDGLRDADPLTRSRALRAVGELKRHDLSPALGEHFADGHSEARFWAAWSAVLLGDEAGLGPLKTFVNFDLALNFTQRALQLGLRAMPLAEAHNWLKGLAQDETHLRDVLIGCGVTGDPRYVPWLIKNMENPEHARVAGESFSMITGVDLAYEDLETDWPEGFEAGPTEDPADEDVAMDQDEDLPWPDQQKLNDWWADNKARYQAGARYLCGKPITIDQCQHVLRHGFQRQRIAAALELALLEPGQPLFETRAPGFRQQQALGLKRR